MIYKQVAIGSIVVSLVDYPLECPECHNKTTPNYQACKKASSSSKIYAFLSCPNPQCDVSYVAEYGISTSNSYYFKRIVKGQPRKELFPTEIETLSPLFIKIYNEAFSAEQLDLSEIAGVGYRKALEFLIKDYLISKSPEKSDVIKNLFLGKCISELVEDNRIKESAKRAVWLGNDQTHYVKKWEDKDLIDLKKLIRLTVNWVESEVLTNELKQAMPE